MSPKKYVPKNKSPKKYVTKNMSPKNMSPKKYVTKKICHQKLCHQKKYLTYYYMLDHVIFLLLEAHGWLLGLLRRPTLRPVAVQDLGVPSEDEPGLEGSSIAQSFSF
jgi:hypothetical protein